MMPDPDAASEYPIGTLWRGAKHDEVLDVDEFEDPPSRYRREMPTRIVDPFGVGQLNPAATRSNHAFSRREHILHPFTFAIRERKDIPTLPHENVDRRLVTTARAPANVLHERETGCPTRDGLRETVCESPVELRHST
jgi:hypothetical protein